MTSLYLLDLIKTLGDCQCIERTKWKIVKRQTVYTKSFVRHHNHMYISAKQGEHLEQDSKNTRKRLKTSQPDDLPGNRRESAVIGCKSVIANHADRNNCITDWEGATVIDIEHNRNTIWIKEVTWIRKITPVMNRDEGDTD